MSARARARARLASARATRDSPQPPARAGRRRCACHATTRIVRARGAVGRRCWRRRYRQRDGGGERRARRVGGALALRFTRASICLFKIHTREKRDANGRSGRTYAGFMGLTSPRVQVGSGDTFKFLFKFKF